MKRIRPKTYAIIFLLTIAFLIIVSKTFGQQTFAIGNKTSLNLSYGGYAADSAQRLPWRPSQFPFFDSTGRIYYNRYGDSAVYYHNGLRWVKLATGSSSGTVTSIAFGRGLLGGTITTSGNVSIDSTIIWTTRQVDSAIASFGFGHGTVTSVGSGYGITGGPITSSGTLVADTTKLFPISDTGRYAITPAQLNSRGYGTGTVTSVTAGTGLSGGVITTTGTISMPNTGTAGTYGSSSLIPVITTDAQGRVTTVTTSAVGGGTVTSVATGYGLSGGPITSTGTIVADTTKVIPFTDTLPGNLKVITPYRLSTFGYGTGTVTSVATSTGIIGGTITSTGTIQIDSSIIPKWDDTVAGNQRLITPTQLNAKGYGTGTVTSVSAGTGLSGGTITTTGTISLPNTGTAGTFGSSTTSLAITTDAQGRITSITTSANPQGTVTSVVAGTGLSGGTITGSGTISMPNVGTSATYGTATSFPVITTDAQGRVSGVTTNTITAVPTASTPKAFDANGNDRINIPIVTYSTVPTAATTTTLTVTSAGHTDFTGTTTQTVLLPVTSTLQRGTAYLISNLSTGVTTVQSSGANNVQAMASNTAAYYIDTAKTTTTGASDWEVQYAAINTTPVPVTNGGNGLTARTTGDILYGSATNTDSRLAIGATTTMLRVVGGIPAWVAEYAHTIATPSTGGTVALTVNQYNIINPAGALATLTVTLPSSPNNNDMVMIKYTQAITAVTYSGGTVADAITAPSIGQLVLLVFDSGTTKWY